MQQYAAIFHAGDHYFFGGESDKNPLNSILLLNGTTWTWSNVGTLNLQRHAHGVILAENSFMVIGGFGWMTNEICQLTNQEFTCYRLATELNDYALWPILYLVDDNYGNC